MGSENQPRDDHGRWAAGGSGSESGDHQSESPSIHTRNIAGQNVPRSLPVVRLGENAKVNRFASAKSDKIRLMKEVDQRHYGVTVDTQGARLRPDTATKTDFGRASPIAPGKLDPRKFTFISGGANTITRAAVTLLMMADRNDRKR